MKAPLARGPDYFASSDKDGGWRVPKDPNEIRDLAALELWKLDVAYKATQRSAPNGGLLVARHGYPAFEKYFGRSSRNENSDIASTGKEFTCIACGIMLEEFKSNVPQGFNTTVFTKYYLSEVFPLEHPRKAEITLGQLLFACRLLGRGMEFPPDMSWARCRNWIPNPARTSKISTSPR